MTYCGVMTMKHTMVTETGFPFEMAEKHITVVRHHRWIVGHAIWAAVLAVVLVFAGGCGAKSAEQPKEVGESVASARKKYATSQPYDVANKEIVLGQSEGTTFKLADMDSSVTYEPWFRKSHGATPFVLYRDPELHTVEQVYSTASIRSDGTLTISPKEQYDEEVRWTDEYGSVQRDDQGKILRLKLSSGNRWGTREILYLAQYNDLKTGKLLKKPLVHLMRIKPSGGQLARPSTTMRIGDDGNLTLSWKPVRGAAGYVIMQVGIGGAEKWPNRDGDVTTTATSRGMLASTTATSWTTGDRNRSSLDAASVRADDLADGTSGTLWQQEHYGKLRDYELFVLALDDDYVPSFESDHILGRDIAYKIPLMRAGETLKKENILSPRTIDDVPVTYPVTMADGMIRRFPVHLDEEGAKLYVHRQDGTEWVKIPFRVIGTELTDEFYVRASSKDYRGKLADHNRKALAARATGSVQTVTPMETRNIVATKKDAYSDSIPSTDYVVEADNALEEYLGANMAAGKEYLDLKAFPEVGDDGVLRQAMDLVRQRNPILPAVISYYYSPSKKLVELRYGDLKDALKQTTTLISKVSAIKKAIIKDGMGDEKKVDAINRYIADHAQYDYEALDKKNAAEAIADQQGQDSREAIKAKDDMDLNYGYAWKPEGVLLKGKGVCASYASAFQLLASQSGLESAYITGQTSGGMHAWNYVKVNREWKMVDPTWNDSDANPNAYLNLSLKDDRYLSTHIPDSSFVNRYHN